MQEYIVIIFQPRVKILPFTRMAEMRKTFLFVILLVFSLPLTCFAQDLNIPPYVNSPQALADWLSSDFSYVMTLSNGGSETQTPQETIEKQTGQCGDFAVLASEVLSGLGIPNNVLIIKCRNLKIMHAICIWMNKDGTYSFISNQELNHTRKKDAKSAIKKFYPDCERVFTQSPDGALIALNNEAL